MGPMTGVLEWKDKASWESASGEDEYVCQWPAGVREAVPGDGWGLDREPKGQD